MLKKKCRECGEEYEAPEFEYGLSHRTWCIPRRIREIEESMELEALCQKMEDEHQKRLIKEVLVEAGVIKESK